MQGKDVRVVTTTPSGRADCAEPLTGLLEQQGVLIKSVSLELNGNTLTFKLLRSDDVTKEASIKLPLPNHAAYNPATGLLELLDSENKVLFYLPSPSTCSDLSACSAPSKPRPVTV